MKTACESASFRQDQAVTSTVAYVSDLLFTAELKIVGVNSWGHIDGALVQLGAIAMILVLFSVCDHPSPTRPAPSPEPHKSLAPLVCGRSN